MDCIRGVIRMRYRRPHQRLMYRSYYHKPLPRAQRIVIFLIFDILMLFTALSIILMQFRPIILKLATARASQTVLDTINTVIDDEISSGTFDYSQLVTLDKDESGNITALVTNMALINLLQAKISKNVLESVQNETVTDIKIPIGNAVGGIIFSGRGPSFDVKILSVANCKTKFSNDFSAAGINQTRHKIMLDVSVDIDVFVPGTKAETTTVTSQMEVCETVIVGKVPNVYADIGSTGGN